MDSQNKRGIDGWLRRAASWLGEFADPLLALLSGIAVGISGVFGWITGDALPAATLLVLSVVAFSLLRERSQRLRTAKSMEDLGDKVAATEQSVQALHSRSPYHVIRDESVWDIERADGTLVLCHRRKKIRLLQDDVLALYDWGWSDGQEDAPEYTGAEKVDNFTAEGKSYSLLSLRRFYPRNAIVDLGIRRTMRNALTANQERINHNTLDRTELLIVIVIWPAARPPKATRINRTTAAGQRTSEDAAERLEIRNGRPAITV